MEMMKLKKALALDWDVLAKIEQEGIETVDTNPFYLYVFLFHLYLYSFAASVISRNYTVMEYRFANGLYDCSLNGFFQLFW